MKFNLPGRNGIVIVFRHPTTKEDEHGNIIRGITTGMLTSRFNKSRDDTTFTPIK